jgi:integrase
MGKAPKRGRLRGHHKAMSYQDMPTFTHRLSTVADQSARAIEITVLTVARTHEIQNMRWSQLDLDHGNESRNACKSIRVMIVRVPYFRAFNCFSRNALYSEVCPIQQTAAAS